MSVHFLNHPNGGGSGPAHKLGNNRVRYPGLQHAGTSGVAQIVKAAFHAGAFLGNLPRLFPASEWLRGVGVLSDAAGESELRWQSTTATKQS